MLCDLLYHHISTTPSPPSQLHTRDSRSRPPFFLYKAGSVYRTVPHISISTLHKSGINIISISQHSSITTITSVLSPQHVILKKFPRVFPVQLTCCSSFCSHACCPLLLLFFVGVYVQDHPPSTGNVFNECLFPSGLHPKGYEGIGLYILTANSFRFPIPSFCFY